MFKRIREMLGGSKNEPEGESAAELAAAYYQAALQAMSEGQPDEAIRQLAFATELDDSYRVRAIDDPAFTPLHSDSRYRLLVTRRPLTP